MKRFLLLTVLFLTASLAVADDDRPNVIMAFADDWGKYASIYAKQNPGGPSDVVSTPHFDQVAKEGLLFNNAYVSAPSCTPCRSSLLSGQHFWRCERASILQGAIWDFSLPAYPLLLQKSGYRIGHTYKVWSPGSTADAPHGGQSTRFAKAGRRFNGFSQNAMKADDHQAMMQTLLDEVRQNFLSFVDGDNDGKSDDDPFCYWFGPTNCHRKWIAGSGKALWNIDPDDLQGKLPSFLPDVATVREDFADYLGEVQAFDAALGVIMEEMERLGLTDNTILVVSGDHGIPGIPRGKCNLYDLGTQVPLAIRWPDRISNTGRVIDDFVSLPDLAPTFLDAANVSVPETMTAQSLISIFYTDRSGWVEETRDCVYTGRERHVAAARSGYKPYPQRAIRTDQFLYIINFEPDRWPMGTAAGLGSPGKLSETSPEFVDELTNNTFAAFGDLDASPTKAWIVTHRRQDPQSFEYAVGLRPRLELYQINDDPDCLNNLAGEIEYADVEKRLHSRLMGELRRTGDPRVTNDPIFEQSPYTDAFKKQRR